MPNLPGSLPVSQRHVLVTPDWMHGSAFGGYLVAQAARLALDELDDPGFEIVSVAAVFHRPVAGGVTPALIRLQHRGARSASSVVTLGGADRPLATLLIAFGGVGAVASSGGAPTADPTLPAPSLRAAGDLSSVADWRAIDDPWSAGVEAGDTFESWIRPLESEWMLGGELNTLWYAVATDLLGPALVHGGASLPFRMATTSLQLSIVATTRAQWLRQRVSASRSGSWARAEVTLSDPSGALVAVATQHAMLLDADTDELPVSVTAFGWGRPDPRVGVSSAPDILADTTTGAS